MKTFLLLFFSLLLPLGAANEEGDAKVFSKSDEASYTGKVVVIKVGQKDLVNKQAFRFFRRTLRRIDAEQAKAVVFDLNTPGGYAQLTIQLMMDEMAKLTVPSFAYVNPEASSAGALISVATDAIYMAPVSSIGSAAIVSGDGQEIEKVMRSKIESAFDSFVRSVVVKKGHNVEVVQAMMFPDRKFRFGDIKVAKGDLLNLTADEAAADFEGKPLLAKGIVASVSELLVQEGIGSAEVVEARMTGFERIAYWAGAFGPVLILIGLAGGYLEMKSPGFGLGGGIALVAFGLFFFGNNIAGNLAGYEVAAIFALGLLLIILDIFILPGTFVLGFTGVFLMVGSLLFAMIDRLEWEDLQSDEISRSWSDTLAGPAMGLAVAILGSIIVMALMMRFLPNLPFLNRYLLPATVDGEASSVGNSVAQESRVGFTGKALTALRPSGKAQFGEEVIDVTSESSFVNAGAPLRVVSESSMRVVVKEIEGE